MGTSSLTDAQEEAPHIPRLRKWFGPLLVEVGRRIVVPGVATRALVLCYHSIHPTASFRSATPRLFAQHLAWLKAHCRVVPFPLAVRAAAESGDGRPVVAITFDDGFADNYQHAFPLLQEHGISATFFVTAGLLEKDPIVLDQLRRAWGARPEEIQPLDWPAVREMHRAGMDIGAHTYSHPNLARLGRQAAAMEVQRSKDIIEQRLGSPVRVMAYPFGQPNRHYTEETVSVVSGVGYEYAAAVTWRGIRATDSRFRIPRFSCSGDGIGMLRDMIAGAWDLLGAWQERRSLLGHWSPKHPLSSSAEALLTRR